MAWKWWYFCPDRHLYLELSSDNLSNCGTFEAFISGGGSSSIHVPHPIKAYSYCYASCSSLWFG